MPAVGCFCHTPFLRSGRGPGGRREFEVSDRDVLRLEESGVVAMTRGQSGLGTNGKLTSIVWYAGLA
jgi:hypothetical protein